MNETFRIKNHTIDGVSSATLSGKMSVRNTGGKQQRVGEREWIKKQDSTSSGGEGHSTAVCRISKCEIRAHHADLVQHASNDKHIRKSSSVLINEAYSQCYTKVQKSTYF